MEVEEKYKTDVGFFGDAKSRIFFSLLNVTNLYNHYQPTQQLEVSRTTSRLRTPCPPLSLLPATFSRRPRGTKGGGGTKFFGFPSALLGKMALTENCDCERACDPAFACEARGNTFYLRAFGGSMSCRPARGCGGPFTPPQNFLTVVNRMCFFYHLPTNLFTQTEP